MERARCSECGAKIGGEHHTLIDGNAAASEEVARLESIIRRQS